MAADAEPAHPFDLVSVWLAALAWVADSRWRRLSGGTHTAALLDWVEGLDLRVVALRLAQPEDFGAGDSPGGWDLCSTAEEVPRGLGPRVAGNVASLLLLDGTAKLLSSQSFVLLPYPAAGSPNKLLSAAAERLRQVKQHIPGLGREAEAAGPDGAGAAVAFPEAGALEPQASSGKEHKLGSRLRGFLGGKKKEGSVGKRVLGLRARC